MEDTMIEGLLKIKEVFYDILTAELLSKTIVSHSVDGIRQVDDLLMRERPLPVSMNPFMPMIQENCTTLPILTANPVNTCAQWCLDNGKNLSTAKKTITNAMWKICFDDHGDDHTAIAKRLGVSTQYVALNKKKSK
jgi:hypothetical protein